MKHMSFSLTTPQFRDRTKRVTRRLQWLNAKAGDLVMGVEKGMGLKKGEKVVRLGEIVLEEVRRDPLRRMTDEPDYGAQECVLEGFPEMSPAEFVAMFCRHNGCTPEREVARIAFAYR